MFVENSKWFINECENKWWNIKSPVTRMLFTIDEQLIIL